MSDVKWLDDREQRAWRSLIAMQEGLGEFLDRQLRSRCGLSSADFRVLAHLSEASAGRLRSFALARLLRWEKIGPPHRALHDAMQLRQRGAARHGEAAPDERVAVDQGHQELVACRRGRVGARAGRGCRHLSMIA